MTPEDRQTVIDAQREAFEAAMGAAGYECNPPIYRDGTYRFAHYAAGWEMWQAATAAERERAANLSPNGLGVLASDGPGVVWKKYSAAIRKG